MQYPKSMSLISTSKTYNFRDFLANTPRKGIAGEWTNRDIVVPVPESEALNAKAKIVANTMERQLQLEVHWIGGDGWGLEWYWEVP